MNLYATMTSKERSDHHHVSSNIIIPQRNQKRKELIEMTSAAYTTITTESEASSSTLSIIPASNLNFSSGQSLTCLKAMVSQDQLHEGRHWIKKIEKEQQEYKRNVSNTQKVFEKKMMETKWQQRSLPLYVSHWNENQMVQCRIKTPPH